MADLGLSQLLLSPAEAERLSAPGGTDASVLLALYDYPETPRLIFTKRRIDMRRHAGEISFPGGRRDHPDEALVTTALREAEEEVGLDRAEVTVAGALPPVGTFVTGYKVHPFVGTVAGEPKLTPNPDEVAEILILGLDELRAGYAMRRLVRRGIPIRTPTYDVGGHTIWGATARILGDLLQRLDARTS